MSPRRSPRTRLLPGLVALHGDLGDRLREARNGPKGEGIGHKQEMLAHAAGISRSTLSRIEKGHVRPRMDTLERLMAALDITNVVVGEPGLVGAGQLMSPRSIRDAKDADLGARLREQRRLLRLSIAEVAAAAGCVSAAQLSRVERGQSRRSRLIAWCTGDPDLRGDDRPRIFVNPVLDELVHGIWRGNHLAQSGTQVDLSRSTSERGLPRQQDYESG